MKPLVEGKTYPFVSFELEERIDLVKSQLEVFYCVFPRKTPQGTKFGLFRNNLNEDGMTDSYTVIGEEFGYDEVKICPIGVNPVLTVSMFAALISLSPKTCQIVSLDYKEGCHVLCSGTSLDECAETLKDSIGMRLYFDYPDFIRQRARLISQEDVIPTADALNKRFGGRYVYDSFTATCSMGDIVTHRLLRVTKKNGKCNLLDVNTWEEFFPVDLDEFAMFSRRGMGSFAIDGAWMLCDLEGVLPDYRQEEKGWYSYDCLPSLLAGEDISRFKQDQYNEYRSRYNYYDPNESNPGTLVKQMRDFYNKMKG